MTRRRLSLVVLILAAAGLYAGWCGLAMTWDGGYQFFQSLSVQRPYVYGTRFHSVLLWWPLVGLSRCTENASVLQLAFGLPFLLAPAVAIALSWWVVGKSAPRLMLWPIFGVAIAALPGQAFAINDSIFQQHLFWPVFLGLFVPLSHVKRIVLVGLALLQLSHPIGIVLLGVGIIAGALIAREDVSRRKELAATCLALAVLAVAAAIKLKLYPDAQAADEFHLLVLQNRWRKGVAGAPLEGLSFFWLAGLLQFGRGRLDPKRARMVASALTICSLAAMLAGLAVWFPWAADEHRWAFALDYRRWVVPLTMPFFFLCTAEAVRTARRQRLGFIHVRRHDARPRAAAAIVAALVFATILTTQSRVWQRLTQRLVEETAAYPSPIVPRNAIPWIENTPLQHWATVPYLAALQGKTPSRILLYDPADRAELSADPAKIPIAPWSSAHLPPEPGRRGWYDFRPLVAGIHARQ